MVTLLFHEYCTVIPELKMDPSGIRTLNKILAELDAMDEETEAPQIDSEILETSLIISYQAILSRYDKTNVNSIFFQSDRHILQNILN